MKTKSKCKIIFAYINAMSLSCILGVALEYLSGRGFARIGLIVGGTLYILSKFAEKVVEAFLIETEKKEK